VNTEFDPVKDEANIAKHGISLSRAVELASVVVVEARFEEARYRLYGTIDGIPHCAAVTIRGKIVRVINLRRAHAKELRRHGW
jgi:uncharacterized DUF497 family protein